MWSSSVQFHILSSSDDIFRALTAIERLCASLLVCRYGKPGCDAETCDYFLSYRRIGTDVEYEMSADTDGWVAVGFSSDKKMVSSHTA